MKNRRSNLRISIVMPCFNTVDYIERSIRSVIEQDYDNFELFIKDGGSTDGTVDIIKYYAKKYPTQIRWISSKDKGQTDAINIGMKKVNGDILTYLNADDIYKKGTLSAVAKYFSEYTNVMWAYGKADIIDGEDKQIRRWITMYKNFWLFWLQRYSYTTLLILNYISQMACFWRKEAATKIGEFDINQHYVMDYDYWLRLGEYFPAGFINRYLASFRIAPTTKSSSGFLKQFKDEYAVAKLHTKNGLIIGLHYLHYLMVISIYSGIKFLNKFL